MVAQIIIAILVIASLLTSGIMMAEAKKELTNSIAAITQPKDVTSTKKKEKNGASKKESTSIPSETKDTKLENNGQLSISQAKAKQVQPVLIELSATKKIYNAKDNIIINAELWALQPTTICIYPQRPEANFTVDLYRAGFGKIDIPPSVVKLNHVDQESIQKIELQPGQMYRINFNLKALVTMPPHFWKTGEYRVQTKFFLCDPNNEDEMAIPSQGPLHLLVLE